MKPFTAHPHQRGLSLVEVLVVVALALATIFALLLPVFTNTLGLARANGMRHTGMSMYKAIFPSIIAKPGETEPFWLYPGRTNGFSSSTSYFRTVVTQEILRVDFSFFSGPGLEKTRNQNPDAFRPSGNAWNVSLDVAHEPAATPFFFSRNFLAGRTQMVASNETLSVDMLGEPKAEKRLDFDRHAAVVITKAGTGFVVHKKDFKEGLSAARVNPTPYRGPFLKP